VAHAIEKGSIEAIIKSRPLRHSLSNCCWNSCKSKYDGLDGKQDRQEKPLPRGRKLSNEKKVVKGGFRATLALIISIIALAISLMAYTRTGNQSDLDAELNSLKKKLQELKSDTSENLEKVRTETGQALEKLGKSIKKGEN